MPGSLSTKLRVLRVERGLTLRDAEQLTGVDKDTLSKIERGRRHPHDVTLAKIADGYGVPVEELLVEPVPLVEAARASGQEETYSIQLLHDLATHSIDLAGRLRRDLLRLTQSGDLEGLQRLERDSALQCIGALSTLRADEQRGRAADTVSDTRRQARELAERAVSDLSRVCDEVEARVKDAEGATPPDVPLMLEAKRRQAG